MIELRRSAERGHADHGWLDSFHTFSFAGYHDPRHMGFGPLRVINEDRVPPGRASARTATATWRSSATCSTASWRTTTAMGNGSVIRPGDVQRMSAGTGVHAQRVQPLDSDAVAHFLQIWIEPGRARHRAVATRRRTSPTADKRGRLRAGRLARRRATAR